MENERTNWTTTLYEAGVQISTVRFKASMVGITCVQQETLLDVCSEETEQTSMSFYGLVSGLVTITAPKSIKDELYRKLAKKPQAVWFVVLGYGDMVINGKLSITEIHEANKPNEIVIQGVTSGMPKLKTRAGISRDLYLGKFQMGARP